MTEANSTAYANDIQGRSTMRYIIGLTVRWIQQWKYVIARRIARSHGATIGEGVIMPMGLARIANRNLTVGDHTSIQTKLLDLRNPITIGNNVIIGHETEIITTSHNIDSPEWEHKAYGITIDDYAWIPTKILILPSCRHIGKGAVVSSGSVVVKDIEEMSIVSGNPANEIRKRKCVHTNLVVESLLGGDYEIYKRTRKGKNVQ